MGTQFNVWGRGTDTRVIVKDGKVNLRPKQSGANGVVLVKNQSSEVRENLPPQHDKEIDADYMLGWLDGKLVFDRKPLSEIAPELERHFNVQMKLENEELGSETVTAVFNKNSADQVVEMISLTLGIEFEKNGDVFYLKEKNEE